MMRTISLCLFLALGPLPLGAQQSGDSNRDYTVDFNGSFSPSYVVTTYNTSCAGGFFGSNHNYITSSPNAPVVWAAATQGVINWISGLTANSVDIGPAGLSFVLDGLGPSLIAPFIRTDSFGNFNLAFGAIPVLPNNTSLFFAMAHPSASSSDGFYVSQTHRLDWTGGAASTLTSNPAAVTLPSCDDCSANQVLGFNYTYYGTTYTQVELGSNGTICFGNANPGFQFDPASFVGSSEPQVAPYTTDLNPFACGTWNAYVNSTAGILQVTWLNVTEFGGTNDNNIQVTLDTAGSITFQYGNIDCDGSTGQIIVTGLTPGNNIAPGLALNLSAGTPTIAPLSAPFEAYDFSNLSDLDNHTVIFLMNAQGRPTSQTFF